MAFKALQKSYEERGLRVLAGSGVDLKTSPLIGPLRSDPRFTDLLRRMNLQP